ncbi:MULTISPECIES: hypothetical protein [unclassified Shinella]|jgi:hypothetical protein|uniref:hypothetical protein n=1 Tax=unclassified Shinella TaxID=2643062 RepID=UPI00068034D7|nr:MULTISPECIES: hypothetical protein [unclassified Shinella]KNY18006.1 hypothetical protein AKG11_06870 [Shinella sp. SUS2]KOC73481.1 hypothetical protein AKG10_21305 [Shinella sp. GWS1]MCO5149532.1 hypothetical protein [Shinella sp.]MDC7262563.1 hypothetical protein [Shinella sp. HY16]MDC7269458.1 hypothetical protein [Shinella sp. YZ44]
MMNFLPDLHEGHAPITLQQLFGAALEALDAWEDERAEPMVIYEDQIVPIGTVFESMRTCTDILPRTLVDIVSDTLARNPATAEAEISTFGDAAQLAGALVEQRRLCGEAAIAAFLDHHRVDKRRPA